MKVATLFLVLLSTILVVSCTSSTSTPTPTPGAIGTATPVPTATPTPEPTPTATEVVSARANFRRVWQDPPTLDPALATDGFSIGIIAEIFSGLVTLSTDDPDQVVVGDLAESWSTDDDGSSYTFHIRDGVLFHDGTPVTAQDFRFSLERALDPANQSPSAPVFLNDILGAEAFLGGEAQSVSGIEAISDLDLKITLEAPRAYFISKITHPVAFVVDRGNVEQGPAWTREPNGTGAFKLKRWAEGEEMVLERNESYYGGVPRLTEATFILTGGSRLLLYETGEIDVLEVETEDVELVTDPDNSLSKEVLRVRPDFSLVYIAYNNDEPPFDDREVRQAFNLAVDKETIATELEMGLNIPAYGILPPGFPGNDPDFQGLRFDPSRAKRLIDQSSYAGSRELSRIVLTVPASPMGVPPYLEAITEMWRQNLGVQVETQQLEFGTFIGDMLQGNLQVFAIQWVPDYPDPHAFLDILFHSESFNNVNSYKNVEVDRLLETARNISDSAERLGLYQEAERAISEDATWLPLWFSGDRLYLVKPYVRGFNPSPLIRPILKDVFFVAE